MAKKSVQRTLIGVVVSHKMMKTIVVLVERSVAHPLYKKVINRKHKIHVHDNNNDATTGDRVKIKETRPLSKTKSWVLDEIIEKAG